AAGAACGLAVASPRAARSSAAPPVAAALRRAYILSFRSPDLLANAPDDRWGRRDGRLYAGRIATDFPVWLRWEAADAHAARAEGRPVVLALNVHSGFGTGLVTYAPDLGRAEAVNYPWLLRQVDEAGLNEPDVTITVDTCNAQATAAHQIRSDLVRAGVSAF